MLPDRPAVRPGDGPRTTFRSATYDDDAALRDLERAASRAALGHIYPPHVYPYPSRAVLDRWGRTLREARVHVVVAEQGTSVVALIAWDRDLVRHLAVHPDLWGTGLADAAMAHPAALGDPRRLWCLADNHRAQRFYRRRGWTATDRTRRGEWEPHPVELELRLGQSRPLGSSRHADTQPDARRAADVSRTWGGR